ncbi:MAG: undecaprenyl-diphosphate phosphatase [Candidatus Saccharimonas aalborgensis]
MDILQTVVMGLVQGATEFIPVSSSGHLVIAQHFMKIAPDHLFLEYINIGTLLALITYYRREWRQLVKDIFEQKKYSLAVNIVLTSLPAGLIGFFLADFIDGSSFFVSVYVVLVTLSTIGVVMIILERLPRARSVMRMEELSWYSALTIGFAQVLALIPGVSRSGSTIIAGRLVGLTSSEAARYSFMASLPIMLAVSVKLFLKSSDRLYFIDHMPAIVISNVVAFVAGVSAISFLMRYLSGHSLALFGWYRIILSIAVLSMLLIL